MKPTPTERDNLVEALVAARVGANISLERVGAKAGVTAMAIWQAERRHSTFSVAMLRAYASLCGLDVDRLLLAWGHVPEDVTLKLRENPQLLAVVRGA